MSFREANPTVVFAVFLTLMATAHAQSDRLHCDGDLDGDGRVTVDEIVVSVDNALTGCPPPSVVSATPTPAATPSPTVSATCAGSSLTLASGVSAACVGGIDERGADCSRVHLVGDCPVGRACTAATAHCSCVGGPLGGQSFACQFMTIPGGIRCGGVCTGECVISIEAQ